MNSVTLTGNLTRDPELRFLPKGTAICTFGIAVNEKRGERETVGFYDIKVWGNTGEECAARLKKGTPVIVSGKLDFESWEDKTTGAKRSKVVVQANDVGLIIYRPKERSDAPDGTQRVNAPMTDNPPEPKDDSVPF